MGEREERGERSEREGLRRGEREGERERAHGRKFPPVNVQATSLQPKQIAPPWLDTQVGRAATSRGAPPPASWGAVLCEEWRWVHPLRARDACGPAARFRKTHVVIVGVCVFLVAAAITPQA